MGQRVRVEINAHDIRLMAGSPGSVTGTGATAMGVFREGHASAGSGCEAWFGGYVRPGTGEEGPAPYSSSLVAVSVNSASLAAVVRTTDR